MTKAIIQCSSSKRGQPFRWEGQIVKFVAHPEFCESTGDLLFAHPDDQIPGKPKTWRDLVMDQSAMKTCLGATDLYEPPIYGELANELGTENTFILSAGWGLVRGDFRLPYYDITFTTQGVDKSKRRGKKDQFNDFNQLPNSEDDCVLFSGKAYLPLIYKLTAKYPGMRVCYYKSENIVRDSGIEYCYFETNRRTNWHYDAAKCFLADFRAKSRKGS